MSKILIGITTSMTAAAKTAISSATINTIFGEGPIVDDVVAMFYSLLNQAVYIACVRGLDDISGRQLKPTLENAK